MTTNLFTMPQSEQDHDSPKPRKKRVLVVGAGCSGLTAIKACLEEGLEPLCLEKTLDIGGLWRYSDDPPAPNSAGIYHSLVINTCKEMMAFSDFPISDDVPQFLTHQNVLKYFRAYADHFNLLPYIRFNCQVKKISPAKDYSQTGKWEVSYVIHLNTSCPYKCSCDVIDDDPELQRQDDLIANGGVISNEDYVSASTNGDVTAYEEISNIRKAARADARATSSGNDVANDSSKAAENATSNGHDVANDASKAPENATSNGNDVANDASRDAENATSNGNDDIGDASKAPENATSNGHDVANDASKAPENATSNGNDVANDASRDAENATSNGNDVVSDVSKDAINATSNGIDAGNDARKAAENTISNGNDESSDVNGAAESGNVVMESIESNDASSVISQIHPKTDSGVELETEKEEGNEMTLKDTFDSKLQNGHANPTKSEAKTKTQRADVADLTQNKKHNSEASSKSKADVTSPRKACREVVEVFDGVMVCTGHHTVPYVPDLPGMKDFLGTLIHSQLYKRPSAFADQRVVVMGIGNSAVDIAADLAKTARKVYLSTRRGSWIVGRTAGWGIPADMVANSRLMSSLPQRLLQWSVEKTASLRMDHDRLGLTPKHRLLGAHPTINDEIPFHLLNGRVEIRPAISRLLARAVQFQDGSIQEVDAVIMATGYDYKLDFLDPQLIQVNENRVRLYKYVFPPHLPFPTLGVIGLVQAIGAVMPVSELQCRWFVNLLLGRVKLPIRDVMEEDINSKQRTMDAQYYRSRRHTLQTPWIECMDEIAEQFGAKPDLASILFQDPALALRCYLGPCLPAQYRLQGPKPWPEAPTFIRNVWKRALARRGNVRDPGGTRSSNDSLENAERGTVRDIAGTRTVRDTADNRKSYNENLSKAENAKRRSVRYMARIRSSNEGLENAKRRSVGDIPGTRMRIIAGTTMSSSEGLLNTENARSRNVKDPARTRSWNEISENGNSRYEIQTRANYASRENSLAVSTCSNNEKQEVGSAEHSANGFSFEEENVPNDFIDARKSLLDFSSEPGDGDEEIDVGEDEEEEEGRMEGRSSCVVVGALRCLKRNLLGRGGPSPDRRSPTVHRANGNCSSDSSINDVAVTPSVTSSPVTSSPVTSRKKQQSVGVAWVLVSAFLLLLGAYNVLREIGTPTPGKLEF